MESKNLKISQSDFGIKPEEKKEEVNRKHTFIDYLMISLALFSVLLLLIEYIIPLEPLHTKLIIYADLVIVAIFFTEFMYNVLKSKSRANYIIEHWYDIIGMIPAAHPVLRGFRLFRIFRVIVIASRFMKTVNLAFGENIIFRILGKYKDLIVEELYQMMTVRALDMVRDVTGKTDYSQSVHKVLLRRQDDIREIVTETMDKYAQSEWITRTALYKRFKNQMSDVTTNAVIEILEDEKTNELLMDVIQEIIADIQHDVRLKIKEQSD